MKEHERVFKGMELINSIYMAQRDQTHKIIKEIKEPQTEFKFRDIMTIYGIKYNTDIYNLYKEYYELNQL